jgi:hypothetical protein
MIASAATSLPSSACQTIAAAPVPLSSLCGTTSPPAAATRKPFVRLGPRLTPHPDSSRKNNNSPPKTKIPVVSSGPATLPSQQQRRSSISAILHKPMRMRRSQSLPLWSDPPLFVEAVSPMTDGMARTASLDALSINNVDDAWLCLSDNAGDACRRWCFLDGAGHSPHGGQRHVTFTSVRIREYSTILGDHSREGEGLIKHHPD